MSVAVDIQQGKGVDTSLTKCHQLSKSAPLKFSIHPFDIFCCLSIKKQFQLDLFYHSIQQLCLPIVKLKLIYSGSLSTFIRNPITIYK